MRRLTCSALLMLALALPPSAHAVNPATGKRDFTVFMSPDEEIRVGRREHPKVLKEFGGAYDDPDLAAYVDSIGQFLAQTSELPRLEWTFTILNTPTINAFALPGGYIYVTRGLLALAEDEAQLAAVIGHEIGHVTARHSAQRYSRNVLTGIGTLAADLLLGGRAQSIASTVGSLYIAGYSREQEHEADRLGIRYISRSGHETAAMARFLAKLEAEKALTDKIRGRAGRTGTSLLATHPPTRERVARTRTLAARTAVRDPIRARSIYLGKIDGMIYGDDPAQGFAKGRDFIHPQLGFTFRVPPGFSVVNSARSVTALGPGDARIIFDAAPEPVAGSMRYYLTRVWGGRTRFFDVETIRVNGMEAATGRTRVRTGQGLREVRAVAVRWDARTVHRFLFVGTPARIAALGTELRRTTHSFRRLTGREAASARPARLRIRTVRPGDTIDGLASAMPFETFGRERLLVLNGLAPDARLEPGQLIKVVAE